MPPPILPLARPNTGVFFTLYDDKSSPAVASPLKPDVWKELLTGYSGELPQHIEGMIRHGAKIGYDPQGPLRFTSRRGTTNLPMDTEAIQHVNEEILRRVEKREVLVSQPGEHIVASPIGAVPKPSVDDVKKWRTIHHLSYPKRRSTLESVNDGINSDNVTLNYYNLDGMLLELSSATRRDPNNTEGGKLWKVDLKDAYRHVVIDQSDARLLGYFWPTVGFVYETQLSFGGRSAPFIFNLVAEAFEWILRRFGVDCHHYLDDSFGWLDSLCRAEDVLPFVVEVAGLLGLSTAPHKTMMGPIVEILGITIDCDQGKAYIAKKKLDKIRGQIQDMEDSTNLLQIQSLTGSLVFVTKVCTTGKAFLRRLFDQVRLCEVSPFSRRRLTQDARRELRWWKDTLLTHEAVRFLADDPAFLSEFHVWSDASGTLGIGEHLIADEDEFSERIPEKHREKDILFKEGLAVLRCTELWKERMHRKQVVFHVDNQALVAAINHGSCKHRPTQALIRRVYTLSAWHSFSIRAVWLSSEENARADRLSRFTMHEPRDATIFDLDDANFNPDVPLDNTELNNIALLDNDAFDDATLAGWWTQFS